MLRSILAVIVGYVAMAVITIIAMAILAPAFGLSMDPTSHPTMLPGGYLAGNVIGAVVSAVVGGWVCGRLAPRAPLGHALILAGLVFALGLVFATMESGKGPAPRWYFVALPIIGAIGAAVGGRLAVRPAV